MGIGNDSCDERQLVLETREKLTMEVVKARMPVLTLG